MAIRNPEDLKKHLQWALQLEHSTIPPYLCALYSLQDGSNAETAALIRSVVIEEMLHMVLVANVLNAIGGSPKLDEPDFLPSYPHPLPHSADKFEINLLPFGRKAVATFLRIETPAKAHAPPEANRYHTIGQFYAAIEEGLQRLSQETDDKKRISFGHSERQVGPQSWYYGSGGDAIVVTDLETALQALAEVTSQGEGIEHGIFDENAEHGPEQLAHFFRFEQIQLGRRYLPTDRPDPGPTGAMFPVDWSAVHAMAANPRAKDYLHEPAIHRQMTEFNRTYSSMLRTLHLAFNGQPGLLFNAVPAMYQLKYMAQALMQIPSGRGDGSTVGPSFEYVPA